VTVPEDAGGQRFDVFVAAAAGMSRTQARAAVEAGDALLNGTPARPSVKLRPGDAVALPSAPPPAGAGRELAAEDIPLDVVHEDSDVAVIDKPAGMVVHPAAGHDTGTLVHALLGRYPELRGEGGDRPGIVHRLDKDTSGLMLVARNARSMAFLQDALREHRVLKEYTLLCCGTVRPPRGSIEAPIGRHPANRLRMAVVSSGRAALTEYETVRTFPRHTLALARLHTGRTHQIRVHFASAGHPLAGDALYGACTAPALGRQFLHSSRLALTLPNGRPMEWRSPLPPDLARCLAAVTAGPPGAETPP
jgi:23S rRNA pseudouridine1911/1915/1917 synthase